MINSKLTGTLRVIKKKEFKELEDFVNSPFHNKNVNVRKLLTVLKPFHPLYASEKLDKEFIYAQLFPGKPYADKTIRNLFSDLLKLSEEFLTAKNADNNILLQRYLTTTALAARGLLEQAERSLKKRGNNEVDFSFDGGKEFFFMHLLEMEKDFIDIRRNKLINLNMKEGEFLVYSFLTKYFIFKMKYANYVHKLGTEMLSDFMLEFGKFVDFSGFIKYLEAHKNTYNDIVLMYFYTTRFLEDGTNESDFIKVKTMFAKYGSLISRTEKINMYLNFNSYCIRRLRAGDKKYSRELLGLYKDMLTQKLLLGEEETSMHITIFNNIVGLGIDNGELEWTRNFIDEYYRTLKPEFKETMKHFADAQYFFAKDEFEKSLECINLVNFENYYIKIGSRMLLLKLYYELAYTESFFSMSDSIKHYISHDKMIPEERRTEALKFVNILTRIARFKFEGNAEKPDEIRLRTEKELSGPNKEWILKKLDAFENQ